MGIINYLEEQGVHVKYARGGWQPCKCPFHTDRTASASVNSSTDRFHCFVCNINEDVIGLIRLARGVGYVEAKQEAAESYGQGTVGLAGESDTRNLIPGLKTHRTGNGRPVSTWRSLLS